MAYSYLSLCLSAVLHNIVVYILTYFVVTE